MRVAQAVSWYLPESSGGCEIYLDGLARHLQAAGADVEVAVPMVGGYGRGQVRGVPVFRYPLPDAPTPAELGEDRPPRGHAAFRGWLAGGFQLYHQHGFRYGCGIQQLRAAWSLGLPTVLTLHMPEAFCPRKTMMWQGARACTRGITVAGCGACLGGRPAWLRAVRGLPPLAYLPARTLRPLSALGQRGAELASAVGLVKQIRRFRERFREMVRRVDRIVAVSRWQVAVLATNGVPPERVRLIRHGVDGVSGRSGPSGSEALRLLFLGRWDAVKGVQLVVEAFRRLPAGGPPVCLDIHAMASSNGDRENRDRLSAAIEADDRICVRPAVPHDHLGAVLAAHDVLLVPSQWLETGPLVVLEALAAGLPVLGSDLGGIAEWVEDGVNGRLLPHDDAGAWAAAIVELAADPERLRRLHRGIGSVPRMEAVARHMLDLYRELA